MKKSTFITTIVLLGTLLTGCGNQNTDQSLLTAEAFYAENEINRDEMKSIKDMLDNIISNQTSMAESIQEINTTNEKDVLDANGKQEKPTNTASPSVETNKKTIAVSILYNNELLAVPLSTSSKFSPFELTYPGHADRNLSIIVSGSISRINLVDEKCCYLANLPVLSDETNNLNYLYFYMDNDGNGVKFYFEIVTTNHKSYYFGIDYHQ